MKFAVIGNGSMGKRRISHLKALKAGRVFGYDIRADRRKEAEDKFGIPTVDSVSKLIAEKPDAIFICTPPAEHMLYLRLAVERKWHFMCENPVYHRPDGLDEIARGVKTNGTVGFVSCNMRFYENIVRMKEIIKTGMIGQVWSGWVEFGLWLPDWHPYEPYTDYYPSRKNKGGGLDAICDLDWMIDIFGGVEKAVCIADRKAPLDIDVLDTMMATLKFKSGPIVYLYFDTTQRTFTHDAKIIGEKGTIILRCAEGKLYLYSAQDGKRAVFGDLEKGSKGQAEEMYLEDTKHYIKCLRGEEAPLNTIESNKYALNIVLSLLEAGRRGHLVRFEKEKPVYEKA